MLTRRRLDDELVRRGLCSNTADAQVLIAEGRVRVAGAPALEPTRRVAPGDAVAVERPPERFVSRGGYKLDGALDAFGVIVTDRRALDAGASTGGFTDCLLQRGVAHVVAVDVGHGLLAWKLQQDPRVTVCDRTNMRSVTADDIGGPVDVVVADLSFIGLRTVASALVACAAPQAEFVLLVKPQFEAPRHEVGEGGIVRDREVRRRVLQTLIPDLVAYGIVVDGVVRSSITGTTGNIEYLVHGVRRGATIDAATIDAAIIDPAVIDRIIDEEAA
ncbi:MAG: TlyA family RNA methyltransferase [Acidimicrobiia bacterium]